MKNNNNNNKDKRKGNKILSRDLAKSLNLGQLLGLRQLEQVGWELKFIRKEKNEKIPFVADPNRETYVILDDNGDYIEVDDLKIRQ